jgi:PAS domain S-box-containing protein
VVFLPIIFEDKVVGALEIGSIETFSKAQKALLELVSFSIGSNILSISAGMYNEKLLAEIAKTNYSLESQKRALDSSAIVAETDSRGLITYVNDKFLEISKYSRNELMGQDHRILNSGYHPKEFFVQLWRTVAKGEIWKNEVRNKAKDGTFYWVDTTIYPVKDSDGKLQKLIAIRFDTSSRKAAEDQLRAASSSLISQKLALDSAAIVAETDNRGCITYVNEKFIEVSKYSRVDLIGQDHRILNSGHHPKEFFVDLWKTIGKGLIWHGEVKNKAADGSYYWVDTTVYPAKDDTGKILKYVAIRFDITDRKAAEESLRQATLTANTASEAKAQFLANISHEIRTPMNGIIGFTSLLSEQNLDQDQSRSVQIIRNCSEHLLVLINDFLDFSKIEAGKVDLEIRPFDLKQLIEESCYLVNEIVEKKGLHLERYIAEDSPRLIMSDPTRVRQILINLISNAVKFTENGAITLTLDAKPTDGDSYELLFCVKDSGIGIATENIDKLFTAFSQAEASTTRRFGGTGLGLAICKKMVELLGGRIWIESKEGQGSSFYFTIMAKSVNHLENSLEGAAINEINEINSNLGKDQPLHILVAEDNSVNQLLVKSLLAKLGYTATFVSNGREAVNAAANERYDVILMDIQMPEMDGFSATREILSKQRGETRLEIIALTANAMEDDRKKCLACGMTGFIPKPYRLTNLSDELMAAIARIKKRSTAA